jgi:L-malate glycosyltransferase
LRIFIASAFLDTWNSVRPEAEIFVGLAARGHEVTIATRGQPAYCSYFREAGIRILDAYPKRKLCVSTIRAYRRELKAGNYDIAYGMNSKTIPNLAFAAIGLPVKLVTYRGSSSGMHRHDPTVYLTHLHPRVDAICCASKAVERVVRSRVWRRSVVVSTVYKGQDVSWFTSGRADLSEFNIPPSSFLIVCVANARPVKGVEVLLEAADAVLKHPDVHLLIVGRGVSGRPYASIRDTKAEKSRIHLVEHRSDALRLVAAASVYVQPSLNEGLPKAVVEAMAQSVPTIVSDAGGMPELVVDGETGWVVGKGSVQALSDALQAAYRMREQLPAMGQRARSRIEREFTPEHAIDGLLSLFESLLVKSAACKAVEPQ